MLNKSDIAASASAISGLLHAGLPISDAAARVAILQPRHADLWHSVSAALGEGHPLSATLEGAWPAPLLAALRAGEQSGTIEAVLDEIEATIDMENQIAGAAHQLIPPALILGAAIASFVTMSSVVVPIVSQAIVHSSMNGRQGSNWILSFGLAMRALFGEQGVATLVVSVGALLLTIVWWRTPSARDLRTRWLFALPVVGRPLRDLQYTLWGRYVSLMLAAGVPIYDTLDVTATVLPDVLAETVLRFRDQLVTANKTMAEAASDMVDWPFYIQNAFVLGHAHGSPESELARIMPRLQKESLRQIETGAQAATQIAKLTAGAIIALTFIAVYSPIITAIKGSV